jgi:hypothetical protein
MILHVLGQIAPDPNDCVAERTRKLIFGDWIGGWHLNYSHRPGAGMFNRHRHMGKTKVSSSFCSANISRKSGNTRSRNGDRFGLGEVFETQGFSM